MNAMTSEGCENGENARYSEGHPSAILLESGF
jgi:hypothetical protein